MGTMETMNADSKRGTILVVGVDSSELADHVLRVAAGLLRIAEGSELHVVTVVRPQSVPPDVIHAIPSFGASNDESILEARDMVRGLCANALTELPMEVKVHLHVRVGRAAEEIEALASEVKADVIVIEAHGRTGLARVFHKSTAADLARNAPCSVLTVRTKHGVSAAYGTKRDVEDSETREASSPAH